MSTLSHKGLLVNAMSVAVALNDLKLHDLLTKSLHVIFHQAFRRALTQEPRSQFLADLNQVLVCLMDWALFIGYTLSWNTGSFLG